VIRVEFRQPAGEVTVPGKGTFRDRFAPDAFAGMPGQRVPFRSVPGGPQVGWATVAEVRVDDDGLGATWVVDVDLPGTADVLNQSGPFSIEEKARVADQET